jgi:hypothetical protein
VVLGAMVATSFGCGSQVAANRDIDEAPIIAGPPVRLEVEHPYFVPGEQMSWKISLRGIQGGLAVLAHGKPGVVDGRPVVIVRSRVESAGLARTFKEVSDDVVTWVDTRTGHPMFYKAELQFGRRHSAIQTRFGYGPFVIDYHRKGRYRRQLLQQLPLDQHVHNAHSVMGVLRGWDVAKGTRAYFFALAGRRLWKNLVQLTGREMIRTSMGLFPAIRIDGIAYRYTSRFTRDPRKKPRAYTLWISDDGDRLPLLVTARTEYGQIRVELTKYTRPEN